MPVSQHLVFKVSDADFALPISQVSRVVDTLQSRFLSTLKEDVEGLFILDNRLIPMIRLDEMLGFRSANIFASNPDESVIIVRQHGYYTSFRVDRIEGVDQVDDSDFVGLTRSDFQEAGLNAGLLLKKYDKSGSPVYLLDVNQIIKHITG